MGLARPDFFLFYFRLEAQPALVSSAKIKAQKSGDRADARPPLGASAGIPH